MKRTVKTVDNRDYLIEEFNNFNELINTNDSRERNFGDSRTDNDRNWRGATYEEAVDMLRYGWQDKDKLDYTMQKISQLNKQQETQRTSFKNDIVGFAPVVPLAIMGVPQNMINSTRIPKKAKVIKIILDVGMASGVSVNEKMEWGAKVTSKIANLEKQGFRVKIECIKTFVEDNRTSKCHVCKVPVKSENQPFDVKRMMFVIAHPAMSRRIMFDWYERLPEAVEYSGYGRSLQYHNTDRANKIKAVIADTENSYYISIEDNIDKVLKEVA